MTQELGRVATPAIVIGRHVFWGFEENKQDIAELLGIDLAPQATPSGSGNGRGEVR